MFLRTATCCALLPWALATDPERADSARLQGAPPGYLRENSTVVLSPGTSWGTWEGWGVSLCWWAHIFGDREDLADAIFTQQYVDIEGVGSLPGLGLNIARYNAGASGNRTYSGDTMVKSSNMPYWKEIPGFWEDWASDDPTSSSWDWTVDEKQVSMLLKAHDRGCDKLELFSNSPMWWMLYDHNPSGARLGTNDNLQKWNHQQFAKYLANIAAHARDTWGITFTSVEAFNEPSSDWWSSSGSQEGCHFSYSAMNDVTSHLQVEFQNRGLEAVITASDENTYDISRSTWAAMTSDSKGAIAKVNTHGYSGANGRRDLLYSDTVGKTLWNSEYGDGDGTGMSLAANLALDFFWLHNTAYCYWQILDITKGWGLLKFSSSMEVEQANLKWWVFAQFTRHIRPGMTIIDSSESGTVAAYDADNMQLVIVTVNHDTARSVTYNLGNFQDVEGPVTRWTTTADGVDRYVERNDLTLGPEKTLTVQYETDVVQTLVISGVTAPPSELIV